LPASSLKARVLLHEQQRNRKIINTSVAAA
jgi:hypothetical protein